MLVQRLLSCGFLLASALASAADAPAEQAYFADVPEVLTVTRLAQSQADTPGAVTVLDRVAIRRLPARNVAELLRYVPGYVVGGYNGAQPVAAYHAPLDTYGVRNLVLIDGRPVYSAYNLGDTHRGMLGVLLDDIERIEILRGANSAAYGANALFGVINIVTQHPLDESGVVLALRRGEGGVRDDYLRVGGGSEQVSWSLSAGLQEDRGWRNAHDDSRLTQLHLRAELRPHARHEISLHVGGSEQRAADGFFDRVGNPARTIGWRNGYLNLLWRHDLPNDARLDVRLSADEESFADAFVYALDPSVVVGSSGKGRRLDAEIQHRFSLAASTRLVWGVGHKNEEAESIFLYARETPVRVSETRLFGNLEWRPNPAWLFNVGGFYGRHDRQGSYFAPRLAVNFHLAPRHTLRAAVTTSWRMPTLLEQMGDVRLYPKNALNLPPTSSLYALLAYYGLPLRLLAASGEVRPEKLQVEEIGYLGRFHDGRLLADVRAYRERMQDIIDQSQRTLPGYQLPPPFSQPIPVADYVNRPGFVLAGVEYQLRWKMRPESEVWLNQSFMRLAWNLAAAEVGRNQPPTRMTSLVLFQKLPYAMDLTLAYHARSALSWGSAEQMLPPAERFDLRLAHSFTVGATRGEAALAIQSANGAQREYLVRHAFFSARRAFLTLRLDLP